MWLKYKLKWKIQNVQLKAKSNFDLWMSILKRLKELLKIGSKGLSNKSLQRGPKNISEFTHDHEVCKYIVLYG